LSATGVTTVQAGTAALPAITTTGDTNTGIFFPAADTVATSVGGIEGTRLTSTGLGIGTSSPAAKLHLSVASAAVDGTKGIRITNPAGTVAVFECGSIGDSFIGTTSGSDFNIRTGNTVRATFDNAGNLLVGTTSAVSGGGVLQVSNGITFPATQSASTDANTLDDYEEGTYTPIDSSGASLSFSAAGGFYTKIGRQVICFFYITFPSTANTSPVAIGGLPFTTGNNVAGGVFTGAIAYNTYGAFQLRGDS